MRFGSLFAGIGGFDLGFERAGMECVWQVEIDPYCRRVLEKHWPKVERWNDVRTFPPEPKDDWDCDLICGGFPCQPVSYAGRRKGKADERWLWPEFARVLRVLRPRWAVLENVLGLLTAGFGGILGDLAELGYDAEWSVLSACSVGAIHLRERVFLVAHAGGARGKRVFTKKVQRSEGFSWCKNVRSLEDLRNRSAILAPMLCRAGDGVPRRMDRTKALGNAVVPQIAEWIGRQIIEAEGGD